MAAQPKELFNFVVVDQEPHQDRVISRLHQVDVAYGCTEIVIGHLLCELDYPVGEYSVVDAQQLEVPEAELVQQQRHMHTIIIVHHLVGQQCIVVQGKV